MCKWKWLLFRCATYDRYDQEDIPEECELYIDGNTHVVAYANVYRLGANIHNQVLNNDMVRVAITKVIYANAKVPVPTEEVTTVGETPNTFIKWPKRLLQLTSNKIFITFIILFLQN